MTHMEEEARPLSASEVVEIAEFRAHWRLRIMLQQGLINSLDRQLITPHINEILARELREERQERYAEYARLTTNLRQSYAHLPNGGTAYVVAEAAAKCPGKTLAIRYYIDRIQEVLRL
jgi:hypothetical protein